LNISKLNKKEFLPMSVMDEKDNIFLKILSYVCMYVCMYVCERLNLRPTPSGKK